MKGIHKILIVGFSVLALVFILVGLYLHQSNKKAARFTAKLHELGKKGPEIVNADTNMDSDLIAKNVSSIQSIYQRHNKAWCEADGAKYASVFTKDADFISFDGTHTRGREEIARSHQELFDTFLKNTCLRGYIERVTFLNVNSAILHVQSGTIFDGGDLVQRSSIQTYVVVKKDGEWLFSSFHNGRIDRIQDRNIFRMIWLGVETVIFRR